MTSSPAESLPLAEAHPVDGSERLVLLDALRGFALCGVFVSNLTMWFSGLAFLARAQMEAAVQGSLLDNVAMRAVGFRVGVALADLRQGPAHAPRSRRGAHGRGPGLRIDSDSSMV